MGWGRQEFVTVDVGTLVGPNFDRVAPGGGGAELVKLHLAACRAARPEPVDLATRWFHLRRGSGLGWFDHFPDGYEDVLGEVGLAEFNRLSEFYRA